MVPGEKPGIEWRFLPGKNECPIGAGTKPWGGTMGCCNPLSEQGVSCGSQLLLWQGWGCTQSHW